MISISVATTTLAPGQETPVFRVLRTVRSGEVSVQAAQLSQIVVSVNTSETASTSPPPGTRTNSVEMIV